MHLKVGITGGIGSGKTTVCRIFEILDIPVYYADERAKILMQEDEQVHWQIIQLLGEEAYTSSGELNRNYISSRVFHKRELLQALNRIVHPAVARDGDRWQESQKDKAYTLKEAALLFESGSYQHLDRIIEVFAPRELRLQRVVQRDRVGREQVEARMDKQWPEWKKIIMADEVILNDGRHSLVEQVLKLHRRFLDSIRK